MRTRPFSSFDVELPEGSSSVYVQPYPSGSDNRKVTLRVWLYPTAMIRYVIAGLSCNSGQGMRHRFSGLQVPRPGNRGRLGTCGRIIGVKVFQRNGIPVEQVVIRRTVVLIGRYGPGNGHSPGCPAAFEPGYFLRGYSLVFGQGHVCIGQPRSEFVQIRRVVEPDRPGAFGQMRPYLIGGETGSGEFRND